MLNQTVEITDWGRLHFCCFDPFGHPRHFKTLHEALIGIPGKKRRRLTIINTWESFQRPSNTLASDELTIWIGFEATRDDA